MNNPATPTLCLVGLSGSGKTTLTAQLIEAMALRGLKVGALKHASHGFEMDKRGKDSDYFRRAGAYAIGVASDTERAIITSTARPTTLAELVDAMPAGLDLILCEGFASEPGPKIGVQRACAPLPPGLKGLVALVGQGTHYPGLPTFTVEQVDEICQFIWKTVDVEAPERPINLARVGL